MQPVLLHREITGAKPFEGSYRVRIVAGAGLGQFRQVDAKESISEMCGTEQGQIQLQKVPGQEGQDRSASEQAKGLRWGSRKQKETMEKWKSSGKQGRQKGATGTRHAVTERPRFPAPPEGRSHCPWDTIQAGYTERIRALVQRSKPIPVGPKLPTATMGVSRHCIGWGWMYGGIRSDLHAFCPSVRDWVF